MKKAKSNKKYRDFESISLDRFLLEKMDAALNDPKIVPQGERAPHGLKTTQALNMFMFKFLLQVAPDEELLLIKKEYDAVDNAVHAIIVEFTEKGLLRARGS